MTILFNQSRFVLKDFLFKNVVLTEDLAPFSFAISFLTKWISGSKEYEISTSGSSGVAKNIFLKRKWLEINALQTIQLLNLWDEKVYCCLPTHKIGGLMMIVRALSGGFDIKIVEPSLDPMEKLKLNHNYTFISLVPSQLHTILNSNESLKKLNRFKTILLGGASINSYLNNRIEHLTPIIYHTYGMTETSSFIALKKLNHGAWNHFKPNPYVELKVSIDGILSIKAAQTDFKWLQSNDVIKLYENQSFDFIGRIDFAINSGGFKIFPESVELKITNLLLNLNINAEVIITSRPHEKWIEEIVMLIKTSSTTTEAQYIEWLKPDLKNGELPKKILKIESWPKNEGGKIDRIALRQSMLAIG